MSLVTVKRTSETTQPTSQDMGAHKLTSSKLEQSLDTNSTMNDDTKPSVASSKTSMLNDKQSAGALSSQRSYESSTRGMTSVQQFRRSLNATTMQLDQHKALLTLNSADTKTSEKYFVVKDAAMLLPRVSSNGSSRSSLYGRSIANHTESSSLSNTTTTTTGDIMLHLKSMIAFLRPEDTLILAVKLFSYLPDKIRYMVIVETKQMQATPCELDMTSDEHYYCHGESVILGLDLTTIELNEDEENDMMRFDCKVGLVLPIYANSEIMLDGDGGFKFSSHHTTHIFKPISIQAMWSAYQYLHKAFQNARKFRFYSQSSLDNLLAVNHLPSSPTGSATSIFAESRQMSSFSLTSSQLRQINHQQQHHEWVKYYSQLVANRPDQSINEWYQREERSGQRDDFTTPYFDCLKLCSEEEETGIKIREKLKEIMMRSKDDYGSMSSVYIRQLLEKELNISLDGFKKFIDATIFQFYNQFIECATRIVDHLYLGTEWNASNYDALTHDGVTHILNVSSEVDNFFLDTFKYLNVRVSDVDETDLLKEFDKTNKFIQEAREQGTSCLVHCKMGVSRSASVVLAYLMKENNWSYEYAYQFTKQKRACINPNDGFKQQLKTYESILTTKNKAINNFFDQSSKEHSSNSSPPLIIYDEEKSDEHDESSKPVDRIKSTSSVGYQSLANGQQKSGSTCSLPGACYVAPTSPTSVNYRNQGNKQNREACRSAQTTPKAERTTSPPSTTTTTTLDSSNNNKFSKRNTVNYDNEKSGNDRNGVNASRGGDWFKTTLHHAQSCPNQLVINDDSSNSSSGSGKSPPVSPFVPAGTVKRQVLSINTNSKPIIDPTTITFDLGVVQQDQKGNKLQRSPNSKRFKCEEDQEDDEQEEDGVEERVVVEEDGNNTETSDDEDTAAVNGENDNELENSSLMSNRRLNQFYKSKRLFERLEDKSRKESGNSGECNVNKLKLNEVR